MAAHNATLGGQLAKRFRQRANEVAPQKTSDDFVRSFAGRPNDFARYVLGIKLWSKQREMLDAWETSKRSAVTSGHKIGKTTAMAAFAIYFYCSYPGARVLLGANTDDQVNGVLWREIRRLIISARQKGLPPVPGTLNERATTGLKDPNTFSEIIGFTAKQAEAAAGYSGQYLLYLLDEASGIEPSLFQVIEGNRMGGARLIMSSNPTRDYGDFYDAFNSKKEFYVLFQIDSRTNPNFTGEPPPWGDSWVDGASEDGPPIPGFATPEMVAEKLAELGESSVEFGIRIKGNFAAVEELKIFSASAVAAGLARWHEMPDPTERLHFGLDPAGVSGEGDDTVFAWRRGYKQLGLDARRGMSEQQILEHLIDLINERSVPGELPPLVSLDVEGPIGTKVRNELTAYLHLHPEAFDLIQVRASDKAQKEPRVYGTVRDELWANGRAWLNEGGALLEDVKLERELRLAEMRPDIRNKFKVTPKRDMRTILKRSTDRADAFLLSLWDPVLSRHRAIPAPPTLPTNVYEQSAFSGFDPYNTDAKWRN